jgi:hypothetical protein
VTASRVFPTPRTRINGSGGEMRRTNRPSGDRASWSVPLAPTKANDDAQRTTPTSGSGARSTAARLARGASSQRALGSLAKSPSGSSSSPSSSGGSSSLMPAVSAAPRRGTVSQRSPPGSTTRQRPSASRIEATANELRGLG